jgi:hypothetical protein
MPSYYLHLKTATGLLRDEHGFAADSTDEAKQEAVAAAREVLAESVRRGADTGVEALILVDEMASLLSVTAIGDVLPDRFRTPPATAMAARAPHSAHPAWPALQAGAVRSAGLVAEISDLLDVSRDLLKSVRTQLGKRIS